MCVGDARCPDDPRWPAADGPMCPDDDGPMCPDDPKCPDEELSDPLGVAGPKSRFMCPELPDAPINTPAPLPSALVPCWLPCGVP